MNKLLNANFMRLKKSKVFMSAAVFMAGLALLMVYSNYKAKSEGYAVGLDGSLFAFTTFIGIVIACFVSLFVGTEYSDGTIRNKIIIGHSRCEIYISNLLISIIGSVALIAVYLAVYICLSLPVTGWLTVEMKSVLRVLGCSLLLAVVFSAIFTFTTMLNQNKAVTAVVSLVVALAILFTGVYLKNRLAEPEYVANYVQMTEEGVIESEDEIKNSRYLEPGLQRDVYEFLDEFLPGGQQLQLIQGEVAEPLKYMGYSSIIILTVTGFGIAVFRRKDLK